MLKYVSVMVMAYRNATGKSEEEALKDLAIDKIVCGSDLGEVPNNELVASMSMDLSGIKSWIKISRDAPAP